MNISIVIPIKLNNNKSMHEFVEHVSKLAGEINNDGCQIVIADESGPDVFQYIQSVLKDHENVLHFIPDVSLRTGDNDKLNGVYAALDRVKYDRVLLIDDHYRITRSTLKRVNKNFEKYDCFKGMPAFDRYPVSALVDLCGMFIINVVDYKKQYCGHLAFRKSHIARAGFPSRDALFDELAIENQLRRYGYVIGFVKDLALEASQRIPAGKFFEQRVRYAYENLALPLRFAFYAMILPLLYLAAFVDPLIAITSVLFLSGSSILMGLVGQIAYGLSIAPGYTFLLSPVWFWFYPFTTWMAVFKYFTGGVKFGGRKVKKAAG